MQAEKFTNHIVADTLDSSEAFEGPEKTLRIFFRSDPSTQPALSSRPVASPDVDSVGGEDRKGLLAIPRSEWETVLDLVKCKVLSVLVHPNLHAYVLSESSLFVYPDYVVLKTCGTTTLLEGVPAILDLAKSHGLQSQSEAAFYSRRSYFNPDKQPHPHGCWDDEVSRLKNIFVGANFAAHFGVRRDERWHLFAHTSMSALGSAAPLPNGFLEIMMTGLDEDLASRFHQNHLVDTDESTLEDSVISLESVASQTSLVGADPDDDDPGHMRGNMMTRLAQVDRIYNTQRQVVDSFAFSPCGYSCNGIMLDEGKYFTIHVTPERGCSYASFETNVDNPSAVEPGLTHQKVVERALSLFEPAKFTLAACLPSSGRLVDPATLFGGKYSCTSEAQFNIGCANVVQMTFSRN